MEVHGATEHRPQRHSGPKRRVFTVEHANRALPLVKRIVADIVEQHKRVSALEDKSNPELRDQYAAEIDKLRELARELTSIGVELKDWRRGLVDFLSIRDGREVYLCWKHGEESIEFWHDLEAGFPGRIHIDEGIVA